MFILAAELCSCKTEKSSEKKPLMVDKNLETDRDLTLEFELDDESPNKMFDTTKHENVLIDLIEQKRAADLSDKVRRKLHNLKISCSISKF